MSQLSLNQYWHAFVGRLPQFLLISVVCAVAALLVVQNLPRRQQVHFSYLVSLSERESASDYRFDGYYALQATDLFAATLAEWVRTPEVIVMAYQDAGLTLPSDDPRQLVSQVESRKASSQLVQVTVKKEDRETALKLAQGLQVAIDRNLALYHDKGIPALRFQVVATTPWAGTRPVATGVIVGATFLAALFVCINTWLFLVTLEPTRPTRAASARS